MLTEWAGKPDKPQQNKNRLQPLSEQCHQGYNSAKN